MHCIARVWHEIDEKLSNPIKQCITYKDQVLNSCGKILTFKGEDAQLEGFEHVCHILLASMLEEYLCVVVPKVVYKSKYSTSQLKEMI